MRGDVRVGERAAHHREVQHPGQGDVVGPPGAAGDQALVLLAPAVLADLALGGGALLVAVMPAPAARPAVARLRGVQHGFDDVVVAGAAAQVALEADPHLLLGGVRVLVEQVDALHDHPRRAEAALEAVALAEGLLHRVQLAVLGQPLDRGDLAARRPGPRARCRTSRCARRGAPCRRRSCWCRSRSRCRSSRASRGGTAPAASGVRRRRRRVPRRR